MHLIGQVLSHDHFIVVSENRKRISLALLGLRFFEKNTENAKNGWIQNLMLNSFPMNGYVSMFRQS
jgi:hypothetical protein